MLNVILGQAVAIGLLGDQLTAARAARSSCLQENSRLVEELGNERITRVEMTRALAAALGMAESTTWDALVVRAREASGERRPG